MVLVSLSHVTVQLSLQILDILKTEIYFNVQYK